MSGRWYRYHEFYPRSTPRQAKGGIKAQSKRGAFGQSWWAKRWIAVLESFHIGARLGRGRSYARRGQVLSIDVSEGCVTAEVQGSRSQPYRVAIKVKPLSAAQWKKLAKALSGQALFVAKLLAGEMPQDIEEAFTDAGLSLFPEKLKDLKTDCSCPDWSNPCKHIAAVYYLLGEEFDRDPFLLFKLRGMSREELVGLLDTAGGEAGKQGFPTKAAAYEAELQAPEPSEPLPCDVDAYWNRIRLPDDLFGEVRVPTLPAALPKRLGSFPFWRAEERFLEAIEVVYQEASTVGMDVFLGEQS
ncbi:MAG: SWIM zinc finger family protein [Phycisphaerae bacterium]|nr:SWIM zinc finger family protein [Phycisphaerae bacterium]